MGENIDWFVRMEKELFSELGEGGFRPGDDELVEGNGRVRGEVDELGEGTGSGVRSEVDVGGVGGVEVVDVRSGLGEAEEVGLSGVSDRTAVDELVSECQEEMKALKSMSGGVFDDDDVSQIVAARRRAKSTTAERPVSPKLTDAERKATVEKWRLLTGNVKVKGRQNFSKSEKQLVLRVRGFCQEEARRYSSVIAREDEYVAEQVDKVAAVPFNNVSKRVQAMTGRCLISFHQQF